MDIMKIIPNVFGHNIYLTVAGFVAVIIFFRLLFEMILPNLISNWRNTRSFKFGESWRDDQDLLRWLRGMTPTEFEEYIAGLFRALGYLAQAIGQSGDHGVDVEIEKDGVISFIQCKKYFNSHKVGEPEVRNFLGALDHQHSRGKGYFVTTNVFTLQAEKFAEDKPIELVDGQKLVDYIRMSKNISAKNEKVSLNTQIATPMCPHCGSIMIRQTAQHGDHLGHDFWGCSRYPHCRGIVPIN